MIRLRDLLAPGSWLPMGALAVEGFVIGEALRACAESHGWAP